MPVVPLGGVAAAKKLPQGELSPAVPPELLVQYCMTSPSELMTAWGTVALLLLGNAV